MTGEATAPPDAVTGEATAPPDPATGAWRAAAAVLDPELCALTVAELGILRSVVVDADTGRVTVTVTPTYTGCPAMDLIRADIRAALGAAGHPDVDVVTVLSPPWSTDMISDAGRAKLAAAGIAPPTPRGGPIPLTLAVRCPRCGSPQAQELSRFGSTACKSLWRCRSCREPFDHLKAL